MPNSIYTTIEKYARASVPSFIAPLGKKIIAWPRYWAQLKKCRAQYDLYKEKYTQTTLYIAGLPKSGTTWLEMMLGSYPGFSEIMLPEAVAYEQKHGESHTYDLPSDTFERFSNALVVLKLHAHGSQHNFNLLQKNNIKYLVIYRDLRDVAVSYIFYVQRTAYHPEHSLYKKLPIKDALLHFGKTLLPQYVQWVNSWQQYKDSPLSMIVRYEELLDKPFESLTVITKHYGISTTEQEIKSIIDKNSFEQLSGGRKQGTDDNKSFFRKGGSGDWKNYFDDEIACIFNKELEKLTT